jgi:hypothetical protein
MAAAATAPAAPSSSVLRSMDPDIGGESSFEPAFRFGAVLSVTGHPFVSRLLARMLLVAFDTF